MIRAIRLTFTKPSSMAGITPMLEQAAGLGQGESLPDVPWLRGLLIELRSQWGFARPLP